MSIVCRADAPQIRFGLNRLGRSRELDLWVLCMLNDEDRKDIERLGIRIEGDQDYTLIREEQQLIIAGYSNGLMYGLIDLAESLDAGSEPRMGTHKPDLLYRGIKFNIPLDARTPSYSDASESAWANIETVWDFDFWRETIDFLALNKYNIISLWSLHPFPSMVRVPGYEDVALEDVMQTEKPVYGASMVAFGMSTRATRATLRVVRRMSMDEKITFWRSVMDYGAERGIRFLIMTWNVFIYGTEHTNYGITDSLQNPVTADYFRKSVETLIRTYPKLYGIGVTAGERMSVGSTAGEDVLMDLKWLHKTYGAGIKDALEGSDREFRFIHRQHFSSQKDILQVFNDLPVPLDFSFKYSQAHMYSDPTPHFADRFFSTMPTDSRSWLTLRNDSLYMLQWGGVEFAREYLSSIPMDKVIGFMFGPDGYTIARSLIEKNGETPPVVKRKWFEFSIWGRLGYEISTPISAFEDEISVWTGCSREQAVALAMLADKASRIMSIMNQVHWHDFDFQHYPEGNMSVDYYHAAMHMGTRVVFHGIHDYLLTPSQPGSKYLGVKEAVVLEEKKAALEEGRKTPEIALSELRVLCEEGLRIAAATTAESKEFVALKNDSVSLVKLGLFFSDMLECALIVQRLYAGLSDSKGAEHALALAESAAKRWRIYSEDVMSRYHQQTLTRFNGRLADFAMMNSEADKNIEDVSVLVDPFL